MKKLTISAIAIILAALTFVLSGCDVAVDLNDETTTTPEPDTAVVMVTNVEGTVVATETITMSAKDKEESVTFFKSENKKPVAGISQDRLEEALKGENAASNGDKTTKPAGDTSEDDPFLEEMNNSTTQEAAVRDDGAVLRSSQYLTTIRLDDGETITSYKIARKNDKSSYTFSYEGQNIGLIFTKDKIYMLSMDEKEYVEFPKETVEEYATDEEMKLLETNIFDFEKKVKKKTKITEDGIRYDLIIYEDGAKDYYIGSKIMKTVDGDKVIYYDSVSPIAPSSLFSPPKGYTKAKLEDTTAPSTTNGK